MTTKIAPILKICARCGTAKPLTEFREKIDARRPGKVYYYSYCTTCSTSYNQEYRVSHTSENSHQGPTPIKIRKANLHQPVEVKTYCEICNTREVKLYADLNPKTGQFRGTLCGACITGLVSFTADKKKLQRALGYLAR